MERLEGTNALNQGCPAPSLAHHQSVDVGQLREVSASCTARLRRAGGIRWGAGTSSDKRRASTNNELIVVRRALY
jgi:hypothetical protein